MDIPALSVYTHQASLSQQAGIAVMKKAMDTAKTSSDALVKMMELSLNPNLGSKIDLKL